METPEIPSLPQNIDIQFLDEGAANVVYQLVVKSPQDADSHQTELEGYGAGTPPPSEIEIDVTDTSFFDNKLLRVRKDLATTFPSAVAQASWARLIKPLFTESQLVMQSLVELRTGNIIPRLNKELESLSRAPKRKGVYLADDDYGAPGEKIIQFKPKWLIQSPTAPVGAARCRTCAMVARKNSLIDRENDLTDLTGNPTLPHEKVFCPLKLLSNEHGHVLGCAKTILGPHASMEELTRFVSWVFTTTLLLRLRNCQQAMDPRGVLAPDLSNEKLQVAMTLRDCTVFVRFPAGPIKDMRRVEARLGDLDVKSPEKAKYWKETERALIDEGWYSNGEPLEHSQRNDCLLRGTGPMWHPDGDDIEIRSSAAFRCVGKRTCRDR